MSEYNQLIQDLTEIWTPPQSTVVATRVEKRFAVPDVFLDFSNNLSFRFTQYALGNMRFVLWDRSYKWPSPKVGILTTHSSNNTIFDNVARGGEDTDGRAERSAFAEKWSSFLAERARACEQKLA